MSNTHGSTPLAGITVIEVGHAIAGPHCAQILADHGANVIKVEPPTGERGRTAPPFVGSESLYFACHNRGKRSVCLDLKTPQGLSALLELCDQADVLVTNYLADVPARLGWSYDVLAERNPGLIYAHITGFGLDDDQRDVRAYDGIIQSMSGVPHLTGPADRPPVLAANFPADHIAAYQAAIAVLIALVERARTGRGALLDVAMFDSYFATLSTDVGEVAQGRPRERSGNKVLTGFSDVFETNDGAVFIAPLGQVAWERFCHGVGRSDWAQTITYDNSIGAQRPDLEAVVEAWAATRTTQEVMAAMNDAGVACGPVRTVSEAVAAAKNARRHMVTDVIADNGTRMRVPGAPVGYGVVETAATRRIPGLGADTAEVLVEFGLSPEHIAAVTGSAVSASASS